VKQGILVVPNRPRVRIWSVYRQAVAGGGADPALALEHWRGAA
jgi:hypothetical protein